MAHSPESRTELAAPATRPLDAGTILVVDDDPVTRSVVSSILKLEEDYHVIEAEDGRAALELARSTRPALVVLDLTMPEMDGFAVCRALRADHELAAMRVLILSAHGDQADRDLAERMGADAYLTKPFTTLGLVEVVRQLTDED